MLSWLSLMFTVNVLKTDTPEATSDLETCESTSVTRVDEIKLFKLDPKFSLTDYDANKFSKIHLDQFGNAWNYTEYAEQCPLTSGGNLCDVDHMLTESWKNVIEGNITEQINKLKGVDIPYAENASVECFSNDTEPVQIYLILARRIQADSTNSTTNTDVEKFGHGLRSEYGFDNQTCKNYILILGVEHAKEIKVWTGSDLGVSDQTVKDSVEEYKDFFADRTYMEGLNKLVNLIGDKIGKPEPTTTETIEEVPTESVVDPSASESGSLAPTATNSTVPAWIYIIMILCILIAVTAVLLLALILVRRSRTGSVQPFNMNDGKPPAFPALESGSMGRSRVPFVLHSSSYERDRPDECNDSEKSSQSTPNSHKRKFSEPISEGERSHTSEISLPRSASMSQADRKIYLSDYITADRPRKPIIRTRPESISSSDSAVSNVKEREFEDEMKLQLSPDRLSTDCVVARRNSDSQVKPINNLTVADHYSSF